MPVVPETNVVISGLLWGGKPRRILNAARDGILELYTSPALLEELEDVLSRPKFVSRLRAANVTVRDLVEGFAALATVVEVTDVPRVVPTDPDDDVVIACAVAGDCEVIVSGDSDLLDMKQHNNISIYTASELLEAFSL